jgi:hypothetical protein
LTAEEEAAAGAATTKTPTPDTERDEEGRRAELVNEGEEASNVNDEESAQEEAKRAAIAAHLSSRLSSLCACLPRLLFQNKPTLKTKVERALCQNDIFIIIFIFYHFFFGVQSSNVSKYKAHNLINVFFSGISICG